VPRRVEKSETAADPGRVERECALVVDHHSTRERGESRASRCIITNPCLFSVRACVFQAYCMTFGETSATGYHHDRTPLAVSSSFAPNINLMFANLE
jgi:hypothetical protein